MLVSAGTFQKRAGKLPEKQIVKDEVEHKVLMIPAPFYSIWYVNDSIYLPEDTTPDAERMTKTKRSNILFFQSRSHASS